MDSAAYRRWVREDKVNGRLVVATDCPKRLRRALRRLVARQVAYDALSVDDRVGTRRPGAMRV